MKKPILILCILFCVTQAGLCPPRRTIAIAKSNSIQPYLKLWSAVCEVESHNNPHCYNATERATGIVQIRPILLRDYNKRTGKRYKLSDMYDPKISKAIFLFYAQKFPANRLDKIARKWNGKGKQAEKYWSRVKSELDKK